MAIVISGNGIDMGGNPVSNASQIDGTVINENGSNVRTENDSYSKTEVDGKIVGFKNYIINGNFDIWQRGTSFTNIFDYTADRWKVTRYAGAINTVTQGTDSSGIDGISNYIRIGFNNGGGGSLFMNQILESINSKHLRGKYVTLSFYARSSTPFNIDSAINYSTASQSAPNDQGAYYDKFNSVNGTINIKTHTLNTNWTKYIQTVFIPNDVVQIMICLGRVDYRDNRTMDFANVQLEEGSIATPFEQRPYGLELSLCQRYYETSYMTTIATGYTSTILIGTDTFKVTKRVAPSITFANGSVVNGNLHAGTTGFSSLGVNVSGFHVDISVSSGVVAGQAYQVRGGTAWFASAEL